MKLSAPLKRVLYGIAVGVLALVIYALDGQDNIVRRVEFADAIYVSPGPEGNLIEHRGAP